MSTTADLSSKFHDDDYSHFIHFSLTSLQAWVKKYFAGYCAALPYEAELRVIPRPSVRPSVRLSRADNGTPYSVHTLRMGY